MAQIRIQNVRKDFGTFNAVKSSTFPVEDGEFFMLLGPSGCGKTTTLRAISGTVKRSGNVLFDGRSLGRRGSEAVARLEGLDALGLDGLPLPLLAQRFGAWARACARWCEQRGLHGTSFCRIYDAG